jgi:dephospho-CoA kinase
MFDFSIELFSLIAIPIINEFREQNKDLIVDGLMPWHKHLVDQIVLIRMNKEDRMNNLLKRGLSSERIDKILQLQSHVTYAIAIEGDWM